MRAAREVPVDTAVAETRFRAFYAEVYPDVLRFVRRRADTSDAEDVTAETFLTAWRRFDDLPAEHDAARAWLFGIARHCLLNHQRARGRREALRIRLADATRPPPGPVPGDDPQFVADRVDLANAWRRLSFAEQETLALTVLDGLTSAQAGAVLGIAPVAYRLRLSRARATLRRHLGGALPRRPAAVTTPETHR